MNPTWEDILKHYQFNESSMVVDVGGYNGKFADFVIKKFNCHIEVFEPVPEFCFLLKNKYINNNKVTINQFGLSNRNSTELIWSNKDSTSLYNDTGNISTEIELKRYVDLCPQGADLLEINIEGEEYNLLEDLLNSDINISIFKNILIQFHSNVPNYQQRRKNIQDKLSKTHYQSLNYEMIFENWKSKDG